MTKEEYLLVRTLPEIPMKLWYEYYRERGGTLEDKKEFEKIFTIFLFNESSMQGSDGQMKEITFKNALDNFYRYYNQKFGLNGA